MEHLLEDPGRKGRIDPEWERRARRFTALADAISSSVYAMSPDWTEMWELRGAGFLMDTAEPNPNWLDQYIFPEDQPFVLSAIENAVRNKATFELEHRVRRSDGTAGWTHSRAIPIFDEAGKIAEWFGAATDITPKREAEEARFRLAAVIASADDAIVSKDLNSIVRSWNPGAERLFGYQADEMVGQSIRRIIPEELQDEEDMILAKIRAGERVEHFETTRVRKNGETIEISVTISPILDDAGQVIGASKIARDISEKKRIQRVLIQSEKLSASSRMAAIVAHELNNPLEAVQNLIYLARQSSIGNPEATAYLENAERELQRASHISRQTLGFYRESVRPVAVLFTELLEETFRAYQPKLGNAAITLHKVYECDETLLVNRGELLQVLSNLIANAIDSMKNGGELQVRLSMVSRDGIAGCQVVIQDTGVGIATENLTRVFEPFFTTKGDLGNGIGLWVCRQIVEKHHGSITIESVASGDRTGTSVCVFLPKR